MSKKDDIIKEQEATIQALKSRLPYWADIIEDAYVDHVDKDGRQALNEMRKTAEEL